MVKAYEALYHTAAFPRFDFSLAGQLSDLFLADPVVPFRNMEKLLAMWVDQSRLDRFRDDHVRAHVNKWCGHDAPPDIPLHQIDSFWKSFLAAYRQLYPEAAHLSLLEARVRETMAEHAFTNVANQRPCEEELEFIVEQCSQAMEQNPGRLRPYELLVTALLSASEHDRAKDVLKTAVSRFTRDKKFLLSAANLALTQSRNAEAIAYGRQALEVDPLDDGAKRTLVAALELDALHHFEGGSEEAGQQRLDEIEPLMRDGTGNVQYSRPLFHIRRVVMEEAYGSKTTAAHYEQSALSQMSSLVYRFAHSIYGKLYLPEALQPPVVRFRQSAKTANPLTSSDALVLARLLARRGDQILTHYEPFARYLDRYLEALGDNGKIHQDDVRALVLDYHVAESDLDIDLEALVIRAHNEWLNDPLFILFLADTGEITLSEDQLSEWISQARAAKDSATAAYGERLKKELEEDDDLSNPFFDDEPFDRPSGPGSGFMNPMIEILLRNVIDAPKAIQEAFRQEMGISRADFDFLLKELRTGGTGGAINPQIPRKRAKKAAPKKKAAPMKKATPQPSAEETFFDF